MSIDRFRQIVQSLNIGRVGTHERPHKPALLLAIISMIEAGRADGNRIVYGADLFARFRRFFELVRSENDSLNMMDPFWRLRTDGLLEHRANPGFEPAVQARRDAPTVGELQTMCGFSQLSPDLYELLQDTETRDQLRGAIVQRYFPARADAIRQAMRQEQQIGSMERSLEADPASGSGPCNDSPDISSF